MVPHAVPYKLNNNAHECWLKNSVHEHISLRLLGEGKSDERELARRIGLALLPASVHAQPATGDVTLWPVTGALKEGERAPRVFSLLNPYDRNGVCIFPFPRFAFGYCWCLCSNWFNNCMIATTQVRNLYKENDYAKKVLNYSHVRCEIYEQLVFIDTRCCDKGNKWPRLVSVAKYDSTEL